MCGIAGYVGLRNAVEVVYDQLTRLEYRGYDSAGIAALFPDGIRVIKRAGKLRELGKLLNGVPQDSQLAIAHSRWATHGGPTDTNAHPHFDQYESIALIHNGIIENYMELREELVREGHVFHSETDTEVAAHVIGKEYQTGASLEESVRKGIKRLRGAFAFVVISHREPDRFVAARNASPLVIGFGEGENMVASDIPALLPYTRRVAVLDDDRVAVVQPNGVRILDLDGKERELESFLVEWDLAMAEKGGCEHFLIKEIREQPEVAKSVVAGRLEEGCRVRLEHVFRDHVWQEIDRVNIIACGTAYHAGLMGKLVFERMLRLPTDVFYSSEFRYGDPLLSQKSLAIFISQSGETADSLAALRLCKQRRIRTLGIVNVVGSSIARECDRTLFTQAGPEISVASTKAYTAQVMVLMLLAMYVAQVQEMPGVRVPELASALGQFPSRIAASLALESQIAKVAERFSQTPLVFFIGRGADAPVALEGALKLKEVAYLPTLECPAGELKHGPLALVEDGLLAVVGATDPEVRGKLVGNIREFQARGGFTLAIAPESEQEIHGVADLVVPIPECGNSYLNALLSVVPMQLLAYHMARLRGCEIDQPRNLAKSVTVE